MTFLDTNVPRVLEEILPARFGGGPTHYQLLEEEAEDGRPCLRLLVHPAISAGSGGEKVMGLVWRNAKLLRVERRVPLVTRSGKILHLIRARSAPPPNTQDGDSAAWGKTLGGQGGRCSSSASVSSGLAAGSS